MQLLSRIQQRYFQVVTSLALPLLPFSSIRHTPHPRRQLRIRSASLKLSYRRALFLSSSSQAIFWGLIRQDSPAPPSYCWFLGYYGRLGGAEDEFYYPGMLPTMILLTVKCKALPFLRVKSAYYLQILLSSCSTRVQAPLYMIQSLALTHKCRLSLDSCCYGPSLYPDPRPLSLSLSNQLALSLLMFLFSLLQARHSSKMRFMWQPLDPMILLATWNSRQFSIWISYRQVNLFCLPFAQAGVCPSSTAASWRLTSKSDCQLSPLMKAPTQVVIY